ncbi:hypothetical protein RFI_09314, partial [Reticulomyxa filosa]
MNDAKHFKTLVSFLELLYPRQRVRKALEDDSLCKDLGVIQSIPVKQSSHLTQEQKTSLKLEWKTQKESKRVEDSERSAMRQKSVWNNRIADGIFEMFANSSDTDNRSKKSEEYWTRDICQVIETNVYNSFSTSIIINKELRKILQNIQFTLNLWDCINTRINDCMDRQISLAANKNSIETLDFKKHWDNNWRKSNFEAAKKVEQMLVKNKQDLAEHKDSASSLLKLLCQHKTKKKRFGGYWMYVIKCKFVVLHEINIDGNVYVVNCKIQCEGSVNITTQLFVTKDAIVDEMLRQSTSFIPWDTNIHHDIPLQLEQLENKEKQCLYEGYADDALLYAQTHFQMAVHTFGFEHPIVSGSCAMLGNCHFYKREYDKHDACHAMALEINRA